MLISQFASSDSFTLSLPGNPVLNDPSRFCSSGQIASTPPASPIQAIIRPIQLAEMASRIQILLFKFDMWSSWLQTDIDRDKAVMDTINARRSRSLCPFRAKKKLEI
jgi:hypothetical protein